MPTMALIIYISTLLGVTAASMTNLMSQSRVLYSQAKDGLFFKVFKEIHPERKIPVKGSWIGLIPIAAAGFALNLKQIANICSLSNLMTYSFIDIAVVILRLKGPQEFSESTINSVHSSFQGSNYYEVQTQRRGR